MIRLSVRSLPVLTLAVALVALIGLAVSGAAGASPAAGLPAGSVTETTPVTLPGGEDVTSCISALPRPGCDKRDTDAMQVAVLLVMTAGVGFIGWRIGRAVRARDRADTPPTSSG